MPSPASVFQQPHVSVTAVPAWSLVPSPRNYNASILEFEGRRLMAYRSHRMDQGGRCGIVVCELDAKWQASRNTWLNLPEQVASVMVHHEDPRLFVFKGRLHVAFTETQFHGAVRPYTCVMKYARLAERETRKNRKTSKAWEVERTFWPRYGKNDSSHQEKNWQFFEAQKGRLHVIYQAEPHTVVELGGDGETVVNLTTAPAGVKWPWGTMRGGTPPIKLKDGNWLTVFHSATAYPIAPYWRRYYAGAYVFEGKAPYRITAISQRPILAGSEHDGHAHDPRNIESWKPFVVFPSGIIAGATGGWHVSYGINDYLTVIAEHHELALGDPGFAGWGPKYFRTENGQTPVRLFATQDDQRVSWVRWQPVRGGMRAGQMPGVLQVHDPRVALHLQEEAVGVEEISADDFNRLSA